ADLAPRGPSWTNCVAYHFPDCFGHLQWLSARKVQRFGRTPGDELTSSISEDLFMRLCFEVRAVCLFSALLAALPNPRTLAAQQAASLPSETPENFRPVSDSFDYVKREVMIPMRDGVRLHTVILIPKGAKNSPILLTRTPYSASGQVSH